jgi:hypothetical protein
MYTRSFLNLMALTLAAVFILSGCSRQEQLPLTPTETPSPAAQPTEPSAASDLEAVPPPVAEEPAEEQPEELAAEQPVDWGALETQVDNTGPIDLTVTPGSLNDQDTGLYFEVVMDTHSIDLSMDLAELATLSTGSSPEVPASSWEAPRGGHHVAGVLSFPQVDLENASEIRLSIAGLGGVDRVFTWQKP